MRPAADAAGGKQTATRPAEDDEDDVLRLLAGCCCGCGPAIVWTGALLVARASCGSHSHAW